jgi:hypothetical protein
MTAPTTQPKSLDEALEMLQADPPVLVKNKAGQAGNQKTRYADLPQVNTVVLSRLNALGVIYICAPTLLDDGKFVLEYQLTHVPSGEHKSGRYPLKLSENPQQMGSAISYARRYVLLSLTGVAAEDEDDDGASGSVQRNVQRARTTPPAMSRGATNGTAQRAQPAAAPQPPLPGDNQDPNAATNSQLQRLAIMFGEIKVTDREERLAFTSSLVGRELKSGSQLTKREASDLMDVLESAKKAPDPVAYLGTRSVEDPDEQVNGALVGAQ